MKNKGFTLIELLAVIIVIGIIAAITSGIIINNLSSSKSKSEEIQKNNILSVAKAYVSENLNDFLSGSKYDCSQNGNVRTCNLNSSILVSENYLEQPKDLDNPDRAIDYNIKITFNLDENKIKNIEYEIGNKIELAGELLSEKILSDNEPNPNPNFDKNHTDNGLYVQQGDATKSIDGLPTYYFRGNVTNNYVRFSNHLWRIVRINEDGSIRLILDGSINDNFHQQLYDYSNNPMKTEIDNWYNNNIGNNQDYDNLIETADFCEKELNFSFVCDSNPIKLKVGTITVDELKYSGMSLNGKSDNSYLASNGSFWTMSSLDAQFPTTILYFSTMSGIQVAEVQNNYSASIRPVINLNSNVISISGNGTSSNPYIVK